MSEVSDAVRVQIMLADYANIDASEKLNLIGAGWGVSGIQGNGFTAPQAVVATIEFPPGHAGEDCAVELGLYDMSGDVVLGPSPTGEISQPVRFAQTITVQQPLPTVPGFKIPKDSVWFRQQMVVNMSSGLLLAVGQAYEWRVSVDSNTRRDWAARFFLPGPAGPIVHG